MDLLAYKKSVEAGNSKLVRLSEDLAVVVMQQFCPTTGTRLKEAMEQVEISVVKKQRDTLAEQIAALDEMLKTLEATPIVGDKASV